MANFGFRFPIRNGPYKNRKTINKKSTNSFIYWHGTTNWITNNTGSTNFFRNPSSCIDQTPSGATAEQLMESFYGIARQRHNFGHFCYSSPSPLLSCVYRTDDGTRCVYIVLKWNTWLRSRRREKWQWQNQVIVAIRLLYRIYNEQQKQFQQ